MNRNNNHKQGFTLVEMMVATSLFLIVAMIVSVAFVTLANIYRKIQSNRAVIDNVNFMMDTISFEMREGINWEFSDPCDSGGNNCFTHVSLDRLTGAIAGNETGTESIEYRWNQDTLSVEQCITGRGCFSLNSPEVDIEKFEIYHTNPSGDVPRVTILMYGTAQASPKVRSEFTLQTSVSQRVFTTE